MTTSAPELIPLPVGFITFHRQAFLNYQLNRVHGLGFADRRDLHDAAARVRSADGCSALFESLSERVAAVGQLRYAAGYQRVAEFFTPPQTPAKRQRYEQYRALFDAATAGDHLTRHAVPYAGSFLPAYRLPATGQPHRGTVLLHGGFDSVIEEFYAIWQRIAAAGFDVIAFDGPGQGGARAIHGLTFDHDWERPVGAVLDHFALPSAGLIGMSMGGYWAIRAAGRDPRISRVVAWPPVYDWLHRLPAKSRGLVRSMLRHRSLMRWSIRARARLIPTIGQVVHNTLYLIDSHDPVDVVDWFLGMNARHLGSNLLEQDVLLMSGEHDTFQPPTLTRAQADALTNARSITIRNFTASENADHHCQIGNIEIACDVLTTWLQTQPEAGRHHLP